jgi:hypothetical protein
MRVGSDTLKFGGQSGRRQPRGGAVRGFWLFAFKRGLAPLACVVAVVTLDLGLTPGLAAASSTASVSVSSVEATASEVTYTIGFDVTGALSTDSSITVTAPSGTSWPGGGCGNYTIYDDVSTQSNQCPSVTASGVGNTVTLTTGITADSGDHLTLTVNGVINDASTGVQTLSVATSSGTAASGTYTLIAAAKVGAPSFVLSSQSASASEVTANFNFTSTAGMTSGYSQIFLTAPSGTKFPTEGCNAYTIWDAVSTLRNDCLSVSLSPSLNTVAITMGINTKAGDAVSLTINGVTNDSKAGSQHLSMWTTSNPVPTSLGFTLTAESRVTALGISVSSPSVNATAITYTVGFTATNGMTSGLSEITLTAPSGVVLPSQGCGNYTISDADSAQSNACLDVTLSASNSVATITIGITTQPADSLTLTVNDVANTSVTGAQSFSVSTTSDPASVAESVTFVEQTKVSGFTFTSTSDAAHASEVSYAVTFKATHAMTPNDSSVTITAPEGTVFAPDSGCGVYTILNDTTNVGSECAAAVVSGSNVSVSADMAVRAGDTVTVVANAVTNPSRGFDRLRLSTTSDPSTVSVPFTLTTPTRVKSAALASSSYSAHATDVTYSTSFTATSGLTSLFSTITLTAPSGTVFPAQGCSFYTVTDTTDGLDSNCLTATVSNAGNTVTITTGNNVRAGDQVTVVANGVENPTAAGAGSITVSTTSDPVGVSMPFTATAATSVTAPSLTVTTPSAGVRDDTVGFTSTNGLTAGFSEITLTAPSGDVFPVESCDAYTVTDATDGLSGSCLTVTVSAAGNSVTITVGTAVRPGDAVTVVANGVTGSTPHSVGLSTTSDPVHVTVDAAS